MSPVGAHCDGEGVDVFVGCHDYIAPSGLVAPDDPDRLCSGPLLDVSISNK